MPDSDPLFTSAGTEIAVWCAWCTGGSSRSSAGTEGCLAAGQYGIFTLAEVVNSLCSMAGSPHTDDNTIQVSERNVHPGAGGSPRPASYHRFINGTLVMTRF